MKKQQQPQILMETNYDRFKFMKKNRTPRKSHIKKQMGAIKDLDLTPVRPIIVNENMEIIDGQHTFLACKELKRPIYYIKAVVGSRTNDAMISLNANQKQWSTAEYVENYVKRGHENYQLILDCMKDYPVSMSAAISMVSNAPTGHVNVKSGEFKRGRISYKTIGDILMDFKSIFKGWGHVMFIRAVVAMVKSGKYVHSAEFPRFDRHRMDLRPCATTEQYLKMFEEILNYRRRSDHIKLVD